MACETSAWMLLGAQLSIATAYAALATANIDLDLTSCLVCVYMGFDQHLTFRTGLAKALCTGGAPTGPMAEKASMHRLASHTL